MNWSKKRISCLGTLICSLVFAYLLIFNSFPLDEIRKDVEHSIVELENEPRNGVPVNQKICAPAVVRQAAPVLISRGEEINRSGSRIVAVYPKSPILRC